MSQVNETPEPAVQTTADRLSTTFLKPDEAQILMDWAHDETKIADGAAGTARIHAIVKEIDDLIGNRLDLVADDIEERMIALLVGDLDPKSQTCLEISRDVAQVTAEKDHQEGVELVRRLTQISSHMLRLTAGTPSSMAPSAASALPFVAADTEPVIPKPAGPTAVSQPVAARVRPIPRPTKYPARKPSLMDRLLGRK